MLHNVRKGALLVFGFLVFMTLKAQPPAANFYSILDGLFEQSGTWSSNSNSGNNSGTNPGCAVNGNVNIYVEDSLFSSCLPMLINGNANFIVRNGGHLEITGDVEIFGNAEFTIDPSSSITINGNLDVAGNGDLLLDGLLTVNGDVTVQGNGEACGSGNAKISGSISGEGWCYGIGVLPIDLLSLKATRMSGENNIKLQWKTLTKVNNDRFVIERSSNGLTYINIAEIPGAGNSVSTKNYTYSDNGLEAGTYYYRLSQIDLNGSSETFKVVSASIEKTDDKACDLVVNPNPCVPSCHAILDCPGSVFRTYVLDGYGHLISELIPISTFKGKTTYHINEDNYLMPGVYIINARSSDENLTKKVMIK